MVTIELTPSEVDNLTEFIELCFIDFVREDTSIDNMGYIVDMCNIFTKLKNAKGNEQCSK